MKTSIRPTLVRTKRKPPIVLLALLGVLAFVPAVARSAASAEQDLEALCPRVGDPIGPPWESKFDLAELGARIDPVMERVSRLSATGQYVEAAQAARDFAEPYLSAYGFDPAHPERQPSERLHADDGRIQFMLLGLLEDGQRALELEALWKQLDRRPEQAVAYLRLLRDQHGRPRADFDAHFARVWPALVKSAPGAALRQRLPLTLRFAPETKRRRHGRGDDIALTDGQRARLERALHDEVRRRASATGVEVLDPSAAETQGRCALRVDYSIMISPFEREGARRYEMRLDLGAVDMNQVIDPREGCAGAADAETCAVDRGLEAIAAATAARLWQRIIDDILLDGTVLSQNRTRLVRCEREAKR